MAEGDFFLKRYVVKRTNRADIKPEEQSEKAESYRENSLISLNGFCGRKAKRFRKYSQQVV